MRQEHLQGSLHELPATRYDIDVVSGTTRYVSPDAWTATFLGVPVNQPCLALGGIAFDRRERAIEYTNGLYRGDRYAFTGALRPLISSKVVYSG
uniref:UTRA domain-containing protein n=1 Tax=Nonomuraea bangladeshensis TaxID=404385 RepID=UPI003F49057D